MKTALITGITGQDGALMAALLLEKSYHVYGVVRRASLPNTARIRHLLQHPNLHLRYADVIDAAAMMTLTLQIQPNEIYNFAAQSDVYLSFAMPIYTLETNAKGTMSLLEAMRMLPGNILFAREVMGASAPNTAIYFFCIRLILRVLIIVHSNLIGGLLV